MGCDQKQEVFWGAIFYRFVESYNADVEVQDFGILQKRTWRSLDQQYKKHLQPDVTKWVSVTLGTIQFLVAVTRRLGLISQLKEEFV